MTPEQQKFFDQAVKTVAINPSTLQNADEKLRGNKIFMLAVCKRNSSALEYASEELKNDPSFIAEIIEPAPEDIENNNKIASQTKICLKRENIIILPSVCVNNEIKKTYAHRDCAAFADALYYKLAETEDVTLMSINGDEHFFVRINNEIPLYCDAYGIFESMEEIILRYYSKEQLPCLDIQEYGKDAHQDCPRFKSLVEQSIKYIDILQNPNIYEEEIEEVFFQRMQAVVRRWSNSLNINSLATIAGKLTEGKNVPIKMRR